MQQKIAVNNFWWNHYRLNSNGYFPNRSYQSRYNLFTLKRTTGKQNTQVIQLHEVREISMGYINRIPIGKRASSHVMETMTRHRHLHPSKTLLQRVAILFIFTAFFFSPAELWMNKYGEENLQNNLQERRKQRLLPHNPYREKEKPMYKM